MLLQDTIFHLQSAAWPSRRRWMRGEARARTGAYIGGTWGCEPEV